MSDIKLFRIGGQGVTELAGTAENMERSLQTLIEQNMETFFGVRFLASEYSTGKAHKGRIDSLGLDENGCPVIFEYKQTGNILVYLKPDPKTIALEKGFTRDVTAIGHAGTGNLEVTIRNDADLGRVKPLLIKSYEAS